MSTRLLSLTFLALLASVACAAPHVFWASDPVGPGETVVVIGDGLSGAEVTVGLVGGKLQVVPVIQPSDGSLKFTLPATLKPGLFQMEIKTAEGKLSRVLNRPVVWWVQTVVQPDGKLVLRVFGKNLTPGTMATVALQGTMLKATGSAFALNAPLPAGMTGEGTLTVAVGAGGKSGVSEPITINAARFVSFPQKLFNVRDFQAEGQGTSDDTAAVQAAIDAAAKAGGGVVYFPRGRYQVNQTLEIPRLVTLRGERRDLVNILWPDLKDPLPFNLKGTNSFAIENLTFYTGNYSRFLVADDRQPEAGNIRLTNVTVRANRYRGHMTADEAHRRLQTGGGNQCPLLTLGGENVSITGCDLYSSGMVFWLTRLKNANIAGNTLTNGRWGWYSLSGNDGVIFENNTIIGGDLMSTGGGLNTLDGSKYSRHVYYANNTLRTMFGWDREAMTSDAGGGAYFGKIVGANGNVITLAEDPKGPDNWIGGCLYIMDGKGSGQYREVTACKGREVTLASPFEVQPDANSTLSWCAYQGRCLFIGNDFTDAGVALQFYGNAIEHISAGNKSTRTAGFHNFGMQYSAGIQPNWYLQWLDNEIKEGNVFWGDHDNHRLSGEAHLGVYAFPPADNWQTPLTLATMVRRNRLDNNAHIMLGCEWSGPNNTGRKGRHIRDVLVEGNSVSDADMGIFAFDVCEGLVLRGNTFAKVRRPLDGPGLGKAYITPAERAKALGMTLQSLAADMGVKTDILADAKLKSVLEQMAKLPEGSPDSAKLQTEAVRSLLVAVAKARPEGLPLKMVSPYLGLEAIMPWSAPLHNFLQNSHTGGPSQLDINLTSNGTYPEPLTVTAEITPPPGWQATPSAPVTVDAKTPAKLTIPVVVPAGAWAANLLPVTFTTKIGDQTLKVTQTIRVGSGFLTHFMALGPFPNKSGQVLDRALHPPDDALNLTAEYDGANGKIKWQPLSSSDYDNGFWPNLGRALKTDKGGTAYLLACVNAAKALEAELRLVAPGGVAVIVNGETADTSEKPGEVKVPLSLKAGDNVLLLKYTAPAGEWKSLVEIGPRPDGEPLNGVTLIQPSEFAARPCFAPRQAVSPEVGEIRFSGGVDWKLVWADDFDRPNLGPRWVNAGGEWSLDNGVLRGKDVAFLAYAEKIAAPLRIEYEARCGGGDLSAFWLSKPTSIDSGLLFGFGANGNTINKLVSSGEQVAQADRPLVQAGKWHHVIAQLLPNQHAQLIIDGELSYDQVVTPGEAKYPGLYAWGSNGEFRKVRIFKK